MNNAPEDILRDAQAVMNDGAEPNYSADEYDSALLAVARHEQGIGEDVGDALARVIREHNPRVDALHFAAQRVRDRERAAGRMTKAQAEEQMLALAKREARQGESVALAYARLLGESAEMAKLYDEGERADQAEQAALVHKRGDRAWPLIVEAASYRRRDGESIEQAIVRLGREDPVIAGALDYATGL